MFYSTGLLAEFSTLDMGMSVYAVQLRSKPKQSILELKTRPKEL
jgi:hypothetical protein